MGFLKRVGWTTVGATLATTAVTALLGRRETGSAYAPLNATSHIAFGEESAGKDGLSWRYTGTGAGINASAMLSWAVVQELVFGRWVRGGPPERAVAAGIAVSAAAYVTDYHVVPERLTPGFEKRLSKFSLFAVYGVLAIGLAAGIGMSSRED